MTGLYTRTMCILSRSDLKNTPKLEGQHESGESVFGYFLPQDRIRDHNYSLHYE